MEEGEYSRVKFFRLHDVDRDGRGVGFFLSFSCLYPRKKKWRRKPRAKTANDCIVTFSVR